MNFIQTISNSKKVRFKNESLVYLIPNKDDVYYNGLKNVLWWSNEETTEIKNVAFREFNRTVQFNRNKNRRDLFKIMWYEIDFDKIYEIMETYKLTHKIELKKLCELYIIKT
uniref:Uncharacterized protein n=1 Tax=viral metagenome TaxID=1070528 RepID=A0A6C0B4H4_9ZZZZ